MMTIQDIDKTRDLLSIIQQTITDWGNAYSFRFDVSTYQDQIQIDISTTSTIAGERDEDVQDWIEDIAAEFRAQDYVVSCSKGRMVVHF